jgi:hypothetical protein
MSHQVVTMGIAQRTDVLVHAPATASGSYTMRSSLAGNFCSLNHQPDATAIVYYGTSARYIYQHTLASMGQLRCKHMPECEHFEILYFFSDNTKLAQDPVNETVPWFPITPDPAPPVTQVITIGAITNSSGNSFWTMNGVSFRGDYNAPILLLANTGNDSYPYDPEVSIPPFPSFSLILLTFSSGTFTISGPTAQSVS